MKDQVIKLLEEILNVPAGTIKMDTEIGELPEWDSLHNVQIIAELEEKFKIKISPDDIMDLEDVSDIIDLVEDLTK